MEGWPDRRAWVLTSLSWSREVLRRELVASRKPSSSLLWSPPLDTATFIWGQERALSTDRSPTPPAGGRQAQLPAGAEPGGASGGPRRALAQGRELQQLRTPALGLQGSPGAAAPLTHQAGHWPADRRVELLSPCMPTWKLPAPLHNPSWPRAAGGGMGSHRCVTEGHPSTSLCLSPVTPVLTGQLSAPHTEAPPDTLPTSQEEEARGVHVVTRGVARNPAWTFLLTWK